MNVQVDDSRAYALGIPETATDTPMPIYDELILKLLDKLKQFNEAIDKRSEFIEFLDSIRNYEKESRNMIGFDERESSEFVDIYLNKNSLNSAKRN